MSTRILTAAVVVSLGIQLAFAQMGGYGSMQQQNQPPPPSTGGQQKTTTSITTKTTYPQGVKGYLDSQMASSKDKKFHVSLNGKDLALTPVRIHEERKIGGNKSAAAAEMQGADGKTYEIDFVLSGGVVRSASVGKLNGQKP
jgi:hypothetical protein